MKRRFEFDEYEVNVLIKALIEYRNQLIADGKYSDAYMLCCSCCANKTHVNWF